MASASSLAVTPLLLAELFTANTCYKFPSWWANGKSMELNGCHRMMEWVMWGSNPGLQRAGISGTQPVPHSTLSLGIKEGRVGWKFSIKVPQKGFIEADRNKLFLETLGNSLLHVFLSKAKNSSRGSLKLPRRQNHVVATQVKLVPTGWDEGKYGCWAGDGASELYSHLNRTG